MPAGANHAERRRATIEDIERFQYKLITLGAYYATALEKSSDQFYDLINDALSLSPTRALQSGIMFWVGAAREQGRLFQNVWNTLATPSPPPSPRSRVINGRITFFLDQYCEASGPVLTGIPLGGSLPDATDLRFGKNVIPKTHIVWSRSSGGQKTRVVSLDNLKDLLAGLPPGRYSGKVSWGDRSQIVEAHLARTPG